MRRLASRGQTRGVTFGRVRAAASRLTWSTAERKRARHCSAILNRGSAVAPIASRQSRDKWLSRAAAIPLGCGLELRNFASSVKRLPSGRSDVAQRSSPRLTSTPMSADRVPRGGAAGGGRARSTTNYRKVLPTTLPPAAVVCQRHFRRQLETSRLPLLRSCTARQTGTSDRSVLPSIAAGKSLLPAFALP